MAAGNNPESRARIGATTRAPRRKTAARRTGSANVRPRRAPMPPRRTKATMIATARRNRTRREHSAGDPAPIRSRRQPAPRMQAGQARSTIVKSKLSKPKPSKPKPSKPKPAENQTCLRPLIPRLHTQTVWQPSRGLEHFKNKIGKSKTAERGGRAARNWLWKEARLGNQGRAALQ